MHRTTHLDATTPRGTVLPNTLFRNDAGSDRLAVLFPGLGYRATMPLLHYTQRALQERGVDILRLDLAYDLDPDFPREDPSARRAWIRDDALSAYHAATRQGAYRDVILVGKSIGTLALADILADIPTDIATAEPPPGTPACVWLTPLLNDVSLLDTVRRRLPPSLFVIGTADPLYDRSRVDELAALTGRRRVVVEGADHSLEVPGDMAKTLQAMQAYLSALDGFLANLETNA
jgi:predicted alpha/beta-hydrolase family hydrolase